MTTQTRIGFAAVLIFILMVGVNNALVAPAVTGDLLPQSALMGYTPLQLETFVAEIGQAGWIGMLYRIELGVIDPLFIGFFALWVSLALRGSPKVALGFALIYALVDLTENGLLLWALGGGDPAAATTLLLPVTRVKLGLAAILFLAGRAATRRRLAEENAAR
ncbi:hypothetical protein FIU97_04895 [Roseivivax sp. THAF40]|uniref:hypothetical protein n=1 Tax=unclassified Roseivivax TaxID=2639302 RepID=UPI001267B0FA|nr:MULTISPECIES: hypothetical protein [unclassified Roseivivax]QFS82109.1 hypothetical protein FIV09_04635 [Roseivivax sp. THAF197b]QFT45909.1 hypothetical protein FIU97_04895 [Roseivivax sp. THAF40]